MRRIAKKTKTHSARKPRAARRLRMPVGISDFAKLIRGGYAFIDKTLLIEEIWESGTEVTLITRPRRFGKTLNLSMLQHFFAAQVQDKPTKGLFDGLTIAKRRAIMALQGQYQVIFLSFKGIKGGSFEQCEEGLRILLAEMCRQYPELLSSPQVDVNSLNDLQTIRAKTANLTEMAHGLKLLLGLLHRHYGRKVVILLDEYDTPIHAAYTGGFYRQFMDGFMREFLNAALKDNPSLQFAVLTGVLRIAKESVFCDLNNIDVYGVLDEPYARHFGFTAAEVGRLLRTTGLVARKPGLQAQIRHWFNGYRFGTQVIYNPWSIINCLKQGGALKPHWVNTSGNEIIKELMAQADADFKEGLERLIGGETVRETIDPKLVFTDLDDNSSTALWSLLLFSGYLTALPMQHGQASEPLYELAIPNYEIRSFYESTIRRWFTDALSPGRYRTLLKSLALGNVEDFRTLLADYLAHSASFFDPQGREPEKFYHELVLGMMVGLQGSHLIRSNRESGLGRYDMVLIPKPGSGYDLAVLLEFKRIDDPARLHTAAQEALAQIDARGYWAEFKRRPVKRMLAIGMAFCGKQLALESSGKALQNERN